MSIELRHQSVEARLAASESGFSTIAIENPAFFRSFVRDLRNQIEIGDEGPFFLHVEGRTAPLAKTALLITDPFALGNDEKKEDASFQKEVASLLDEEGKSSFEGVKEEISRYLKSLAPYSSLPYEYEDDFSLSSFLKFVAFRPLRGQDGNLESMLSAVISTSFILRKRLAVICHLHGYFSLDEIDTFHSELSKHDIELILVESMRPSGKLSKERLTIVDCDLCEY